MIRIRNQWALYLTGATEMASNLIITIVLITLLRSRKNDIQFPRFVECSCAYFRRTTHGSYSLEPLPSFTPPSSPVAQHSFSILTSIRRPRVRCEPGENTPCRNDRVAQNGDVNVVGRDESNAFLVTKAILTKAYRDSLHF